MKLSNIKDLLGVYRDQLQKIDGDRKQIAETIAEVSGVVVTERSIVIKKHVVRIHTDAVSRNQLFIFKQKILEALKNKPNNTIFDIE